MTGTEGGSIPQDGAVSDSPQAGAVPEAYFESVSSPGAQDESGASIVPRDDIPCYEIATELQVQFRHCCQSAEADGAALHVQQMTGMRQGGSHGNQLVARPGC